MANTSPFIAHKDYGMAALSVYIAAKDLLSHPLLLTRWSALALKVGIYVIRVAMYLKGNRFIVLR